MNLRYHIVESGFRILVGRALVALALLGLFVQTVAADCQGVDDKGSCLGLKTVRWCDDGVLKEATCPEGEICAKMDNRFTCVPKSYTECADIPDEGLCTSGNNAAWCENGAVKVKECKTGEVCSMVSDGWVDCVPEERMAPQPDVNTEPDGAADTPDSSEDDTGSSDVGPVGAEVTPGETSTPTPPVSQGEPYEQPPAEGCAAGHRSEAALMALLLILMLGWRRRSVQA